MRILAHRNIEKRLIFNGENSYCISIENQQFLRNFIIDLKQQLSGEDGPFLLFDDLDQLSLGENIELITDFFNLDLCNKKFSSSIYKKISSMITDETIKIILDKCNLLIENMFQEINYRLPINISYNSESNLNDFAKMISVVPESNYLDAVEVLLNYLKLVINLKKIDIIFLCNSLLLFTQEEILSFIKECRYLKINLVFIEGSLFHKIPSVDYIIIDKDLCEI